MNPGLPSPGAALAEAARLALTAAIATNPEARRCSERLAGRTLAVETLDARFVVHFEPGAVRVEAGDTPADATVRGSPVDVGATLTGAEETAAVFGDATIFEDFRESFSPLAGMRGPVRPARKVCRRRHRRCRATRREGRSIGPRRPRRRRQP